jgi:hypothetical protein
MARKNRNYKKGASFRDASLFVIICEGAEREVQYFRALAQSSKHVKVEVVSPEHNKSAPKWLLDYAPNYQLGEGDALWLVMDVDRWKVEDIHAINKVCKEQKPIWKCAISNPAFETWLLMHYQDIADLAENPPKNLKQYLHSITKDGYRLKEALLGVDKAIAQAKHLDKNPSHYFPDLYQSKVYQLVEALQEQLKKP